MIDKQGYRANVGIILSSQINELFWGQRNNIADSWQFPQGGINQDESPEQAMYRELYEEIGLLPEHVSILKDTPHWLYYKIPEAFLRHRQKPLCIGQKQRWFLLRLEADDSAISLTCSANPEFKNWRWVDWSVPRKEIVDFKKEVYCKVLDCFESN